MTPARVSDWITFDRTRVDWAYDAGDGSMAARQAEGVAGIWNKLGRHRAALLADEVGMGKTLQALGVMALLWKKKPGARVLVMAPNRDICQHWQREYEKFVRTHYREPDGVVRSSTDRPVHVARPAYSLKELVNAVAERSHQLFITTIYSLSGLVRDEHDADFDKLKGAARVAADVHHELKKLLGESGFDLLVVDEAHYFRNTKGKSQRASAARQFFGPPDGRLAERALLMTATPCHTSMEDIPAILGYVAHLAGDEPEALLRMYALRRLRRMKGRDGSYDKYSYRSELEVPADFERDPAAELFFALYQKLLVQRQLKDGRRFLYGYLEGFESFTMQAREEQQDTEEDGAKRDFHEAPDTEILMQLARMYENLGGMPAHPKYDALVRSCVPANVFDADVDVHEHKHLIFVRRIPSVREIVKRINTAYDAQMRYMLARSLAPDDPAAFLRRWKAGRWSRDSFNRLLVKENELDGDDVSADEDDLPIGEHVDADASVHSQVANLFVRKKAGSQQSTDCSRFSQSLRRGGGPFSLLLEPASDYRAGTYDYCYRKHHGDRLRDDYTSAALRARTGVDEHGSIKDEDVQSPFERPMPTLWGLMYRMLHPIHHERIEWLSRDLTRAESFGHYLKSGFLFASPVIVELYCWYVEFDRVSAHNNVHHRYLAFLDFIEAKLSGSLALAYFRTALETFEGLCENVTEEERRGNWHVLTGLNSPAFYASGAVKDRRRLILGFNTPFYPNVLAATSVMQEGVNLHLQCRKVHHYGIAWTPGDNEQRVGRVDRLFGKVNALLERDGRAELAIHYPYLRRTFDEEQLASFIPKKHGVEVLMDACRQSKISAEIDLREASERWRDYLRKPDLSLVNSMTLDPFPYDSEDSPDGEYQPHEPSMSNDA